MICCCFTRRAGLGEDILLQEIESATRPRHIPLRHRAAREQKYVGGWKSYLTDIWDSLCDFAPAIYHLANEKFDWGLWVELGTTIMVSIMYPPNR